MAGYGCAASATTFRAGCLRKGSKDKSDDRPHYTRNLQRRIVDAHPYSSFPTPSICILLLYSSTKLPTAILESFGKLDPPDDEW